MKQWKEQPEDSDNEYIDEVGSIECPFCGIEGRVGESYVGFDYYCYNCCSTF